LEVGFLYYIVPVTATMQGRDKMDIPHSTGKCEVKLSLHMPWKATEGVKVHPDGCDKLRAPIVLPPSKSHRYPLK